VSPEAKQKPDTHYAMRVRACAKLLDAMSVSPSSWWGAEELSRALGWSTTTVLKRLRNAEEDGLVWLGTVRTKRPGRQPVVAILRSSDIVRRLQMGEVLARGLDAEAGDHVAAPREITSTGSGT
jgi:hypothetical protein